MLIAVQNLQRQLLLLLLDVVPAKIISLLRILWSPIDEYEEQEKWFSLSPALSLIRLRRNERNLRRWEANYLHSRFACARARGSSRRCITYDHPVRPMMQPEMIDCSWKIESLTFCFTRLSQGPPGRYSRRARLI